MTLFFRKIPISIVLLLSIVSFVYVLPLFANSAFIELFNTISYSLMLISIFSIIDNKTRLFKYIIITTLVLIWMMYFSPYALFKYTAFLFSIIVFNIATLIMIKQIVSSKTVSGKVIVEVICGYLLIGVILGFLNRVLLWINPEAIGLDGSSTMSDIVYYSFITVTTIGYGDISPVSPAAKSLSILFGVIGQLYLTIIIALIIGKFLNSKNK